MPRMDQQIYTAIAQIVAELAPADWRTIILSAAMEDDNGEVRYHYFDETGDRGWFSPELLKKYDVYLAFKELRNMMKSAGHSWDRARFTLEKSGVFDVEFDYPE